MEEGSWEPDGTEICWCQGEVEDTWRRWRLGVELGPAGARSQGRGGRGFDWEPFDLAAAVKGRGRGIIGVISRGARDDR